MPDPIVPASEAGPAMPDPSDLSTSASPLPSPEAAAPGPVTFTPDQLEALGLNDAQDGQSFNITITRTSGDENGSQFEVESSEPATTDNPDNPDDVDGSPVSAPDSDTEAPLGDSAPGEPKTEVPEPPTDDDKSILGFARKKKSPRSGLPDTKKMRDL